MTRGRPRALAAALTLGLGAAGCAAPDRDELVGRYGVETRTGRQTWTLGEDGSCRVESEGVPARLCEWLYTERAGRRVVVMTFPPGPGTTASVRLVLTPGRWVVGGTAIPLPDGSVLRKAP